MESENDNAGLVSVCQCRDLTEIQIMCNYHATFGNCLGKDCFVREFLEALVAQVPRVMTLITQPPR